MDNMNGMTPVGLVENEFRVTTSSVPNYQTKTLGLTQYTPNRVTSWLGNYNDDMRKIDNFSSSIGAYVEKVIEESDATHQELSNRINDTSSVIAAVERRVDANFADHEVIRTEIQQAATGAAQKIVESEKRLVEMIAQSNANTSSTLAYVQQQVTENDVKHTLNEDLLNQRLHVVEDEVEAIKTTDAVFLQRLKTVETKTSSHEECIAELDADVAAARVDATEARNQAGRNKTAIAALETNNDRQDTTIATLQTRVGELANIGADVNNLKPSRIYIANTYGPLLEVNSVTEIVTNKGISYRDGTIYLPTQLSVTFDPSGFKASSLTINFTTPSAISGKLSTFIYTPYFNIVINNNLTSDMELKLVLNVNGYSTRIIAAHVTVNINTSSRSKSTLNIPNLTALSGNVIGTAAHAAAILSGYDWCALTQHYVS